MPQMIDLYAQGRFPFDRIIKFYPFQQINDAVADRLAGRTMEVILKVDAFARACMSVGEACKSGICVISSIWPDICPISGT